jgi:hypothetical protein
MFEVFLAVSAACGGGTLPRSAVVPIGGRRHFPFADVY